jgi:predicted metal-dependent phosphoesterase TrpH
LVRAAKAARLDIIALTDHDTTDGIPEAVAEGKRIGIEVIPGIELSSSVSSPTGQEVELHILGYFLNYEDSHFQKILLLNRQERLGRGKKILAKLAELGMPLDETKFQEIKDGKSFGRPHIARALVEAHYVGTVQEAFNRFLKDGRPAYVPKPMPLPAECIKMIRRVGGIAVIAHPSFGAPRQRQGWEALIKAGLNGIEAYHSQHTPSQIREYVSLAKDLNLLVTGGSDFHAFDGAKHGQLGEVHLSEEILQTLRRKKQELDTQNQTIF